MSESIITPIVIIKDTQTDGPSEAQDIEKPVILVTVRVEVT